MNGRAHRRRKSAVVRLRAVDSVSADQHRPHRGHARRRQKWRQSVTHAGAEPIASRLSDGAAAQHDDYGDILGLGQFREHVAPWETRRRWVREAFEALEAASTHRLGTPPSEILTTNSVPRSAAAGRGLGARRRRRPRQRRPRPEPDTGNAWRGNHRGELPLGRVRRSSDER